MGDSDAACICSASTSGWKKLGQVVLSNHMTGIMAALPSQIPMIHHNISVPFV
jgi:hypothetical protein